METQTKVIRGKNVLLCNPKSLTSARLHGIGGVFVKIVCISAPHWLSALIYVLLGWMIVFATVPMAKVMPGGGMVLLFAGGFLYTAGALLYARKKELFRSDLFGNHELFHVFVLLGSLCHYAMIFRYL